jgi:hypothetical protein
LTIQGFVISIVLSGPGKFGFEVSPFIASFLKMIKALSNGANVNGTDVVVDV